MIDLQIIITAMVAGFGLTIFFGFMSWLISTAFRALVKIMIGR